MPETTTTTGSMNTPLTGNAALGQAAGDLFAQPTAVLGTAMQGSDRGVIRGLGAGLQYTGAVLGSGFSNGIANAGNITSFKQGWQAGKTGVKNLLKDGIKNKAGKVTISNGAGVGMGIAGTVMSAVAGPKREYEGEQGAVTKGLDAVWDGAQTAVSFIPGIGTVAGGAMALAKGTGDVLNKLGGGTDAMTDVDAVLGSNFFSWNLGALNGFTGKKAHSMGGKDFMTQQQLDNVWGGYTGTYKNYNYAATKEAKKYGGFSGKARRRANRFIDKANDDRVELLGMNRERELGSIRGNNMANIRGTAYEQSLYGGFNANNIRMGRSGLKTSEVQRATRLTSQVTKEKRKKKKEKAPLVIPEFLTLSPSGNYVSKYSNSNQDAEDWAWYNSDASKAFRKKFKMNDLDWDDNPDAPITYIPVDDYYNMLDSSFQNVFEAGGGSGGFNEDEEYTIWLEDVGSFVKEIGIDDKTGYPIYETPDGDVYIGGTVGEYKNGGTMNVIPEGNLHARLHHMENADNLTKKGIPVVDNNGNQQAEIELNEIIFRKEVTDKLEELAKQDTDEAAIEAGKLLVEEIFSNTDDRTGLINQIISAKNGAKIVKAESGFDFFELEIPKRSEFKLKKDELDKEIQKDSQDKWVKFLGGLKDALVSGINTGIAAQKEANQQKEARLLAENQHMQNIKAGEKQLMDFNKQVSDIESQTNKERTDFYNTTLKNRGQELARVAQLRALFSGSPIFDRIGGSL